MGWVDLDLNLPPPPPDPDGDNTPLPSPTPPRQPEPQPEPERDFFAARSSSVEVPSERDGLIDASRDASAAANAAVRVVEANAAAAADTDFRVSDAVARDVVARDFHEMAVRREDVENFSSREQEVTKGETKVESEDDEIDVVSRARVRIEVDAPAAGPSMEDGIEPQVEEQKPVRKRLRTLGQLRNQKIEKITSVVSPSREKPCPSSSVVTAASQPQTSKVDEEDGKAADDGTNLKQKCSSEGKMELSSSVGEGSKHVGMENPSQQDEKMQVDGEEASSKKKVVVAVKDANSDKRRRSIVVLEGEAQAPPKRPRLPRHPLKRTRSFGGVIVGENLDEGPKSSGKASKLESPQSSESGKISNPLGNGKEVKFPSEMAGSGSKESKRQAQKEDVTVEDNSRDVEMPQQDENGFEVAEGSGVSEEKQGGDKARDASVGVTVPRRPRKMKEIPVPPSRAPRSSTKPPSAVKPTEFIRPTVKKPSVTAPLRRSSSAAGTSSRSDSRPAFQDTTIERLQREATCGKLWQSPGLFLATCNVIFFAFLIEQDLW